MTVTVDDKTYCIDWSYDKLDDGFFTAYFPEPMIDDPDPGRERAACIIRDMTDHTGMREDAPIAAFATVIRDSRDTPNRNAARKESLRKALDILYPPSSTALGERTQTPINRLLRGGIWGAFHQRKHAEARAR
jgi:hypothetical protein